MTTIIKRRCCWAGILGMFLPILVGCASSGQTRTVGFQGVHQERFPVHSGTYDVREEVDDSPDFYHGNYDPLRDPLFPEDW